MTTQGLVKRKTRACRTSTNRPPAFGEKAGGPLVSGDRWTLPFSSKSLAFLIDTGLPFWHEL